MRGGAEVTHRTSYLYQQASGAGSAARHVAFSS